MKYKTEINCFAASFFTFFRRPIICFFIYCLISFWNVIHNGLDLLNLIWNFDKTIIQLFIYFFLQLLLDKLKNKCFQWREKWTPLFLWTFYRMSSINFSPWPWHQFFSHRMAKLWAALLCLWLASTRYLNWLGVDMRSGID